MVFGYYIRVGSWEIERGEKDRTRPLEDKPKFKPIFIG